MLLVGGPDAHAAGCAGSPGCPYLEATVAGREPPTGGGVFRSPQAITVSPDGSFVWVADQITGIVQKFDSQGNWISNLGWYADKGQLERLGVIGGLATDRNNHLYVLDSQYGRVQVFRSDTGAWVGSWGSKGTAPGLFDLGTNGGAGGIAIYDPPGVLTPIAFVADQFNHRIQRFALNRFSTLDQSSPVMPTGAVAAGNPNNIVGPTPAATWGSFGNCSAHGCGQPADEQLLNSPQGVAVNPQPDSTGRVRVYIADTGNHRVVQYTDNGTYLNEVGALGTGNGQFDSPYDVSVDGAGNLYVADFSNHRAQRFNADTLGFIDTWGTLGSGTGQFELPRALGSAPDGSGVFVADTGNQRVEAFTANGSVDALWGTAGRGGPGYVTRPSGLAIDRAGNLFVADTWAHRIEVLSSSGAYQGQWGRIVARTNLAAPGPGQGQFSFPRGVAFDPSSGNVWVADQNNHRIQVLATTGAWVATYGGPTAGSALGQFNFPRAITVAANGDVYVADTGNNRVQKRDASGTWSLVPIGTSLDTPSAIAVDGSGTLFVADRTRVLRVEGGTATPIDPPIGSFDRVGGLHVTGSKLYVSDTGNSRVLRLDRPTGTWQTIGGEGPQIGSFVGPSELSTTQDGRTLYVTDQHNNRIQRFLLELPPAPRTSSKSSTGSSQTARPDRDRPRLRLRVRLRQRVLKRGAVLISIDCSERCRVDAKGKILARHERSLGLRRVRRSLAANKRVTLALHLSKKTKRKLARTLAHKRLVNARIVVIGRDLAGNRTREARRILVRP
jgi:DNA-binding beta-propeller fold protein YncE